MAEPVPARDEAAYHIRAVERVCDLILLFEDGGVGISLHEAARITGMPKSSTFRYLATLEARHFVERHPVTGDYRLGAAFLRLQTHRLDVLIEHARPCLEDLRDRLGETVTLSALDGLRVICLDLAESPRSVRFAIKRGDRFAVHSSAPGKAVLSTLTDVRVRALLQSAGMPGSTEPAVPGQRACLAEIEDVRRQGYAVDDGATDPDGRSISVSLAQSQLPAALSIHAPANRLTLESAGDLAATLAESVALLTRQLQYLEG